MAPTVVFGLTFWAWPPNENNVSPIRPSVGRGYNNRSTSHNRLPTISFGSKVLLLHHQVGACNDPNGTRHLRAGGGGV